LHCIELLLHLDPAARILVSIRDLTQIYGSIEAQHQKSILVDFRDHLADYDRLGRANMLFAQDKSIGAPLSSIQAVHDLPQSVKNRISFVKFEELVAMPVETMSRIYSWLEVSPHTINPEKLMVRPHESDSHYRHKYLHRQQSRISPPKPHEVPPRIRDLITNTCRWYNDRFYPEGTPQYFSFSSTAILPPLTEEIQMQQAMAYHKNGQLSEAAGILEEIVLHNPKSRDALHTLGVIAYQREQYQRAADLIGKAIAINPDNAAYFSDRGLALQRLKQLDLALESYNKAIALNSDIPVIHLNRGNALKELRQLKAAVESYDNAIAIKPDYATAHWNKALEQLILGDFEKGWRSYEWRWREEHFPSPRRNFPWQLWLGEEPLKGKTILLHSEQGLGDTIQFCRYVPLVAQLAGRVIFEVEWPLIPLVEQLEGVSQFVAKGQLLPAVDFHSPLLSLPLAFKTRLDTIPFTQKYLASDPLKVAAWELRLGPKIMPRIGLVWNGRADHQNDQLRSIKLLELTEYLPSGFQYVSLQKEVRPHDMETLELHPNIAYYGDELQDFADTAALCELMDVIISVDTSVAHLGGALGKSTWVLLPFIPDWRWLLDRNDSLWYQSARLYRQEVEDDWSGVLERVRHDLLQMLTK